METLRQVAGSILLAAISVALVIGGISLALAESYVPDIPTPTQTQVQIPVINTPTFQALVFATEIITMPSESPSPPPLPISCQPPVGWIPISVQSGDNLISLALRYKSTPNEISIANCLFSTDLPAGFILYVPPLPDNTMVSCGKPAGWISYTVQAGNTLFSISHAYATTISQLQFANCIPSYRYSIVVGQTLWVPNVGITRTPLATATATLTPVSIILPTLTFPSTSTTPATSTATSTITATPTATKPPPAAPPTATVTAFPSQTPIP